VKRLTHIVAVVAEMSSPVLLFRIKQTQALGGAGR
jgi:hypothetical protein